MKKLYSGIFTGTSPEIGIKIYTPSIDTNFYICYS